jgi:phage FluMu gp28-like protein
VLFYVVDRLPRMIGGALDAGGNGMYLAEQAALRYGASRIQQIKLSDAWYLENMPKFRAAFEDASLEIPRDADVLNDLRALQSIQGIIKLPKAKTDTTAGKQRHGDAAIALALGYIATTLNTYPIEYQTLRPKHEREAAAAYDDLPEPAGAW